MNFLKRLFSGGKVIEKGLDIFDAATDSEETKSRKHQLALQNSKGAQARLRIVSWVVPYTIFLMTAMLIMEIFDKEISDNFKGIVVWYMGAFSAIIAFFFGNGFSNTVQNNKIMQTLMPTNEAPASTPIAQPQQSQQIQHSISAPKNIPKHRDRTEDLNFSNRFHNDRR